MELCGLVRQARTDAGGSRDISVARDGVRLLGGCSRSEAGYVPAEEFRRVVENASAGVFTREAWPRRQLPDGSFGPDPHFFFAAGQLQSVHCSESYPNQMRASRVVRYLVKLSTPSNAAAGRRLCHPDSHRLQPSATLRTGPHSPRCCVMYDNFLVCRLRRRHLLP